MSDDNNLIATDHPLTAEQRDTLTAFLDTLVPASGDGRIPSAAEFDIVAYLEETAPDFVPALAALLDHLDEGFSELSGEDRHVAAAALQQASPELFDGFLFHVYACYYAEDRVLEGIGLAAGPPFPRGNTVEAGDLSLLDAVVENSPSYRK